MPSITLNVNGKKHAVDVDPATPLLWVLRDTLGMTGTKFGCGVGLCGSCTVHLGDEPVRACQTLLSEVGARQVTTIEGLSADRSHPLQRAWIEEEVPQCGYCQPGMIMSAAALLAKNRRPTEAQIHEALSGHICRCGTYVRIRRAVHRAAAGGRAAAICAGSGRAACAAAAAAPAARAVPGTAAEGPGPARIAAATGSATVGGGGR
jgi:aerobic-type carbon monoxide dehydrogenase small subunit (CoxS/CutS family)